MLFQPDKKTYHGQKRAEIGKFVTFEKKIFGFEFTKKK